MATTRHLWLDAFVASYHSGRDGLGEHLTSYLRQLYAPIFPAPFTDADLGFFLGLLYFAVRYVKPHAVVQTGTMVGSSSIAIGLALERNGYGELYTIDPEPPEYFGVAEPVAIAQRAAMRAGLTHRIRFIKGYSTEAFDGGRMVLVSAPTWKLREISARRRYEMLVVDGDHTEVGCFEDLVWGSRGLRREGPSLIIVHDYLGIPDVKAAVRRWIQGTPDGASRVLPSACGAALVTLEPNHDFIHPGG